MSLEMVTLNQRTPEKKSDAELLTALSDLAYLARLVENQQRSVVDQLRQRGATWQHVGDALGVTRSGAQQRFGR